MNISGNYQTKEREIAIVKRILDKNSIPYLDVQEYKNADDGDVCVVLPDGREILIEVKEEKYDRFIRYGGDLGIDYISAFQFKAGADPFKWKRQNSPQNLAAFKREIDMQNHYKGGKVFYSKSHLWLFFVVDMNDDFYYCKFFKGDGMTSPEFIDYIEKNCIFSVNLKPVWQESYKDKHNSACFFLNHKDKILDKYEVDISDYIANF